MGQAPRLLGVVAPGVGADLDPGLAELKLDVLLAHHEIDRVDPLPLGEDQVHRRVEPVLALAAAISDSRLPTYFRFSGFSRPRTRTASGGGELAHVLPVGRRVDDLGPDPGPHRRDRRASIEELAVGRGPGGQDQAVRPVAAGHVGVHVGADVQAAGTGRGDPVDGGLGLGPVPLAAGLQVVDLHRHASRSRPISIASSIASSSLSASDRMWVMYTPP